MYGRPLLFVAVIPHLARSFKALPVRTRPVLACLCVCPTSDAHLGGKRQLISPILCSLTTLDYLIASGIKPIYPLLPVLLSFPMLY